MLTRLRLLTAGESHGPALVAILDGLPKGIAITPDDIANDLKRRRTVAGRSPRQKIEGDIFEVLSGLRYGQTLGTPVAIVIPNAEASRFANMMSPWPVATPDAPVEYPRPGHADMAGAQKFSTSDIRDVLERASARETAARTAAGALAKALLHAVGVELTSVVTRIADVAAPPLQQQQFSDVQTLNAWRTLLDASPFRTDDAATAARFEASIDAARKTGDTLGGAFAVVVTGMPPGVGSFAQSDLRLSARLSEAVSSIQATKAVGIGDAWDYASSTGRAVLDAIHNSGGVARRLSNHAGGIEGGMTNGEPVIVHAVQKPLPTVAGGLLSVNLRTGEAHRGHVERSDTCGVPAGAVVAEAMVALVLADALLVTFGGDTITELQQRVATRRKDAELPPWPHNA